MYYDVEWYSLIDCVMLFIGMDTANNQLNEIKELSELMAEFVYASHWIKAKTKSFPHEYVCKEYLETPEQRLRFELIVSLIRENGHVEYFFSTPYTYFSFEGYKYWTMGNPIDQTIIINRAKDDSVQIL